MYVQAIVTKFLGPTNARGARVKATAMAGSVITSWDYSRSIEQNHAEAAKMLADKFEWSGVWFQGGTQDGSVFVNGGDAIEEHRGAFVTYGRGPQRVAKEGTNDVKSLSSQEETDTPRTPRPSPF